MQYFPQKSPYSQYSKDDYKKEFNGLDVPNGFSYNSGNNSDWETIEAIKRIGENSCRS